MSAEVVGVLGGTFDPVHVGHLRIAHETRERLRLARTLLLPTAVPPHKAAAELSPIHHRLEMLRLAMAGNEGLEICPAELTPERVCYTIETLRTLRDGSPARNPIFIMGMDSLLQIDIWRGWRELLEEFDLAVVERADRATRTDSRLVPEVAGRLVPLRDGGAADRPGRGGRIFLLPIEPIPVSSSTIRSRVRQGHPLEDLVPPAVAEYIQATGIYRREDTH